jgi:hypothetical protein
MISAKPALRPSTLSIRSTSERTVLGGNETRQAEPSGGSGGTPTIEPSSKVREPEVRFSSALGRS